jgi:hypothetical protein
MLAVMFITLLGVGMLLTNTHLMRFSLFAEKSRTSSLSADIGRKLCRRCVPAIIVLVNSNLFSRKVDSRSWSSTDVKCKFTVGKLQHSQTRIAGVELRFGPRMAAVN